MASSNKLLFYVHTTELRRVQTPSRHRTSKDVVSMETMSSVLDQRLTTVSAAATTSCVLHSVANPRKEDSDDDCLLWDSDQQRNGASQTLPPGTRCTKDSSSPGVRRRLGHDATDTTRQGR